MGSLFALSPLLHPQAAGSTKYSSPTQQSPMWLTKNSTFKPEIKPFQVQTRARGVTQTYSAHSFKDFTVKPGEDVSRISGDAWLRAGSGFAVIGGMEEEVGGGKGLDRNQFDRKSQLRRSKKQRKKSSMSSSPISGSPCKTISASVDSSSSENGDEREDDKTLSPRVLKSETLFSSATPRTASGIVRAEMRSEKLTQILLNNSGSRTEYNSNYGNLI